MNDQNPNAPWWCWTDDEPSTFRCRELGHNVRPARKLGDPSTQEWREAVAKSTGARLRQALEANEQLARDLEIAVAAKQLAVKQLAETNQLWAADADALIRARQETEQLAETNEGLTAQVATLERHVGVLQKEIEDLNRQPRPRRPGPWRLTDKGLAALQADTKEPS